jgi:hypothetical protein
MGAARWSRVPLAACGALLVACGHESPKSDADAPQVSLATLDSQVVAGLATRYGALPWTVSLPNGGTVTKKLDAAAMTRAFVRRDSAPIVFAGTVSQILARATGKVVVLLPDYHDATPIADFEVWAECSDSLAALAVRQKARVRPEVAIVSRAIRVERLVWAMVDDASGARDRFYVAGSCLAVTPLPQSASE